MKFSVNNDNYIGVSKLGVPIVSCETRKKLHEDTSEWFDITLGTGK